MDISNRHPSLYNFKYLLKHTFKAKVAERSDSVVDLLCGGLVIDGSIEGGFSTTNLAAQVTAILGVQALEVDLDGGGIEDGVHVGSVQSSLGCITAFL